MRKAINLKMIIGAAVPLILVIASILLYVRAIQPIKIETVMKMSELKTEKKLAKIYQLEKNEAVKSNEQENVEKKLPRNPDLTAFLNDLDGIEKATGVKIGTLTFGDLESEKAKSSLEKIDIQLSAHTTTMKRITDFLKRLEQSPHALIFKRLLLTDQNHVVKADCSLTLYYYHD